MSFTAVSPQEFLDDYTVRALRTLRLVKLFSNEDLKLRPAEGSMTTAEQINHICASGNFLRGVLSEITISNDWFMKRYDVSSADAALRSLAGVMAEVQQAAESVSTEMWEEVVSPWGPHFTMTRGRLAYLMVEHEVHHTGSLHVYARMAGKVPPMLYHPVDETILKDLIPQPQSSQGYSEA